MAKSVEELREEIISENNQTRLQHKSDAYNKFRSVDLNESDECVFTESEVVAFAKTIKQGAGHYDDQLLVNLKNAFLQDKENIVHFLREQGALHSLVGVLIGTNAYHQLLAAECCCNLSLGDGKICYQLAKAAAPYLVSNLKNLNYNLINVCLNTIGNLCGSGYKCAELFRSQGALEGFEKTILIPELYDYTVTTLVMFTKALAHTCYTDTEKQQLINLTKCCLLHLNNPCTLWFLFHMTTVDVTTQLLIHEKIVFQLLMLFRSLDPSSLHIVTVAPIVRTIGNLCAEPSGQVASSILEYFNEFSYLCDQVTKLACLALQDELLWVCGNLLNHPYLTSNPSQNDLTQQLMTLVCRIQS